MVFFVRITVNQSHLRPICKSTKFNPKIQRTIYSINFQRLRLHVLDFIRTVVKYYICLLRLFLYICSISLVVKPIGLPRDNRTLRSKPISQFFSVVTVRSLSHWSLPARQRHTFLYFSNTPN